MMAQSLPIGIGGRKAEMQHPIYLILVFRAPYIFRRTDDCPFYQNMIEVEAENCQVLEFDKSSLELDFTPQRKFTPGTRPSVFWNF